MGHGCHFQTGKTSCLFVGNYKGSLKIGKKKETKLLAVRQKDITGGHTPSSKKRPLGYTCKADTCLTQLYEKSPRAT